MCLPWLHKIGVSCPLVVQESSKRGKTSSRGHSDRITTPENLRIKFHLIVLRTFGEPLERFPLDFLSETPAEPSERQISSESLAEGCAPRMVTLRNFSHFPYWTAACFWIHSILRYPKVCLSFKDQLERGHSAKDPAETWKIHKAIDNSVVFCIVP